jgi:hypothetical protein
LSSENSYVPWIALKPKNFHLPRKSSIDIDVDGCSVSAVSSGDLLQVNCLLPCGLI